MKTWLLLILLLPIASALAANGENYTGMPYSVFGNTFYYGNDYTTPPASSTRFVCGLNQTTRTSNAYFSFTPSTNTFQLELYSNRIVGGSNLDNSTTIRNMTIVAGSYDAYANPHTYNCNPNPNFVNASVWLVAQNGSEWLIVIRSIQTDGTNVVNDTIFNVSTFNSTHTKFQLPSNDVYIPTTESIGFRFTNWVFCTSGTGTATASAGITNYTHYTCKYEFPYTSLITPISQGFYWSYFNSSINRGSVVRSTFSTSASYLNSEKLTNAYYGAYLFYGSTQIIPKITYFPGMNATGDFYNMTTGTAYLLNNTGAYVLDNSTSTWYFCPPYSITSYSTLYSISCIYVPAGAGQTAPLNMSMMFLLKSCYQNGNNYTYFITSPTSTLWSIQQTLNNSTVYNSAFTGLMLNNTTQILGLGNITTNFTISANGQMVCSYTNGTGILFNDVSSLSGFPITKIAGTLTFMLFMGLTAVVPVSAIPAFFINDAFSLLNQTQMFLVFSLAAGIGLVLNYMGERNLKSLGIYVAIGVAILTQFALQGTAAGMAGMPDLSGLTLNMTNLATAFNTANLWDFAASTVGVVINFGLFVLLLPAIVSGFLFGAISNISPNLYTALFIFQPILTFGAYVWIVLKLYEVLANRFRSI